MTCGVAAGADVQVVVRLDRAQVYVGEQAALIVDVRGAKQVDPPKLSIAGAEVTYQGGSGYSNSSVQIINGQMYKDEKAGFKMQFLVRPTQPGILPIPPVTIEYEGKQYSGTPLTLKVIQPEEQEIVILEQETGSAVFFTDQSLKVKLKVFIRKLKLNGQYGDVDPIISQMLPHLEIPWFESLANWQTEDVRKWAEPLVRAGEGGGFAINNYRQQQFFSDVPVPFHFARTAVSRKCRDGATYPYFCYTLEKEFRPLTPGEYTIPAAAFKGEVPLEATSSNWANQVTVTQRKMIVASSSGVSVTVRPIPTQGRPGTFSGAVGTYSFEADATPKQAKVGDPIDLILSVAGDGILEKIIAPDLNKQAELITLFRVHSDAPAVNVTGGTKTFRYTIRAKDDTVTEIPPLSFSYFNTGKNKFETVFSKPVKVSITPTSKMSLNEVVETAGGQSYSRLGKELQEGILANFTGDDVLASQEFEWGFTPGLIALLVLPPIAFAGAFAANRRMARLRSDPALARARAARKDALDRLKRLESGDAASPDFCGELSKVLTFYVADNFHLPREGFMVEDLASRLRERKVDSALVGEANGLVVKCDSGRFGGTRVSDNAEMIRNARDLVNRLEKWL